MIENYPDFWEWDTATASLPRIPLLETMVTHGCTLRCQGCTNYSDYDMSGGNISWSDMQIYLNKLFSRIRVDTFSMIGGEPFLHKEFETWVRGFREQYPYVMLMIVSNGQLISKNRWILDCMHQYGMIYLKLTDHIPGARYFQDAKDMLLNEFPWVSLNPDNPNVREVPDRSLVLEISRSERFTKTYRGNYGSMKPYDNDPVEAFSICTQQRCPLLYQGKLYKCSSLALLERVLQDHAQLDDQDWAPYIHSGVDLDCSDIELERWVNNYGKPHAGLCRMCPVEEDQPYLVHRHHIVSRIQPVLTVDT